MPIRSISILSKSDSISKPYLRWLVFGCSTYFTVRLAASILAALISSLIRNRNDMKAMV
jgi:hypothetical protein